MLTIRWLREQMRQGKSIFDLPLRVTFYARVSTEKVEQQGSLENQIQYGAVDKVSHQLSRYAIMRKTA